MSLAAQNSVALHQDRATRDAALAMARLALADEGGAEAEAEQEQEQPSVDKLGSKELRDKLFKYDVSLETEQRFDKMFAEELMSLKS